MDHVSNLRRLLALKGSYADHVAFAQGVGGVVDKEGPRAAVELCRGQRKTREMESEKRTLRRWLSHSWVAIEARTVLSM